MKKSKRIKKSNSWKIKQHRDQFFKKSRTLGYRSRASFKLIELRLSTLYVSTRTMLLLTTIPANATTDNPVNNTLVIDCVKNKPS